MTLQVSTGFTEKIIGPFSFELIFNYGAIAIYNGTQPVSADHAATGDLLGWITENGDTWVPGSATNGLLYVRAGPFASKNPSQIWRLNPTVNGVAGWFRIHGANPVTGASISDPRIDGAIGQDFDGFDMRMLNTTVLSGTLRTIDQFIYTIPKAGAPS